MDGSQGKMATSLCCFALPANNTAGHLARYYFSLYIYSTVKVQKLNSSTLGKHLVRVYVYIFHKDKEPGVKSVDERRFWLK